MARQQFSVTGAFGNQVLSQINDLSEFPATNHTPIGSIIYAGN